MDYKELFIKKLKEVKEGNFVLIGEYRGSKERTRFKHLACGYEWETRPSTLLHSKGTEKGCPECQRVGNSITTEDFPTVFYNKVPSEEFELDLSVPYKGQREPLKIRHLVCGSLFTTYWGTFFSNTSCPICRKNLPANSQKSKEKYKDEVFAVHGNEYTLLSDYTRALEPIRVRHNTCGLEFSIRASHLLAGHGCRECRSSLGEKATRRILTDLNIPFQEQFTFLDCADKNPLPFDFAIIGHDGSLLGLIEYDGIQHFKSFSYFGGKDKYDNQKYHDGIKDEYVRITEIPLLRISYTLNQNEVKEVITSFVEKISS